jgi:hypothetical protein
MRHWPAEHASPLAAMVRISSHATMHGRGPELAPRHGWGWIPPRATKAEGPSSLRASGHRAPPHIALLRPAATSTSLPTPVATSSSSHAGQSPLQDGGERRPCGSSSSPQMERTIPTRIRGYISS